MAGGTAWEDAYFFRQGYIVAISGLQSLPTTEEKVNLLKHRQLISAQAAGNRNSDRNVTEFHCISVEYQRASHRENSRLHPCRSSCIVPVVESFCLGVDPSFKVVERATLKRAKISQSHLAALDFVEGRLSETRLDDEALAVVTHFEKCGFLPPEFSELDRTELSKFLDAPKSEDGVSRFDFIDLFAGIGGFRLGLEACDGRAVFASEWEVNAKETYYANHGEFPFGDIEKFTDETVGDNMLAASIPNHDVLAGGFPCQPFSRAGVSARNALGKEHGFRCETQGTLFFSIERIARVKRPKILFLENVRNIVSHDGGATFATIKRAVEDIGYKFFYGILDSQTLVPQRRVRCFMVCVRNDLVAKYGAFEFPVFEGPSLTLGSILEKNVDPSYTISDKLWEGHQKRSVRNKARGTGFTTSVADLDRPSNTIVARYGKDGKECLIPQVGKNPRKLTVGECRSLFGYPEDFIVEKSKTATYKLFGNSVVVPVVEAIARKFTEQYILRDEPTLQFQQVSARA